MTIKIKKIDDTCHEVTDSYGMVTELTPNDNGSWIMMLDDCELTAADLGIIVSKLNELNSKETK